MYVGMLLFVFVFPTDSTGYVRSNFLIWAKTTEILICMLCKNIRIYRVCGWDRKFHPIAKDRHLVSHMLRILFLLTIKYSIICLNRLPEVPEYAEIRHDMMMSLTMTSFDTMCTSSNIEP